MNQEVLDEILNSPALPSLPAVAVRVLELTSDPDVKMSDLAESIQHDQAMAAKILRTVNSSFFGLREKCSSIEKALVMLGLGPVKGLVLGFSLVTSVEGSEHDPFDFVSYWRRGLYTSIAAKFFAEATKCPKADEAFLSGLLQDVGMVAMYRGLGERYLEVIEKTQGDHSKLASQEIREFEIQHSDIGAMLCESWKLPQDLVLPVKYHERPTAAPHGFSDLAQCVAMGNVVHNALTQEDGTESVRTLYNRAKQWWNLPTHEVDEVLRRSTEAFDELAGLFDVDAGEKTDAEAVLRKAESRMVELAKEDPRESFAASGLDELIQGDSQGDPLTGAMGRPGFDAAVRASFKIAVGGKIDLTLVQVCIDGLSAIGTEYGEIVADEVAIGLVVQLQRFFEPLGGVVCRLADQVFAVVLPDVSQSPAIKIADQFATQLDKSLKNWLPKGTKLKAPFKASIGIASVGANTREVLTSPDQLVLASIRAVQAARKAGGNSVRAYQPRAAA